MTIYRIEHYLSAGSRKDIYNDWLGRLPDRQARLAIVRHVMRIEHGNFGDHKFCRDGVWELRVNLGPGYRVYYGLAGRCVVLLLCGGDKRRQDVDVNRAVEYWQDWHRRADDEK
ncbi:type II toxin-antitoxin system RelE/ParE family toxin [Rugamonas sp. CCM 8940]|uniref:type II toxin-antitoxin system RelE/ParE family toxin n=1 Tax=Rugamonas sp. CCM 8940 TaxID=2765359 RepID=UPI0018F44F55|nr:type II toxin-antitoxin system RelE/ParE family toxin [Rugamonas sp. CCM 8940]MBJ7309767.1 type II toxin-antitoxin system RelE/ParE family toxin [Rugamonas sp. CCM 8940]